MAYTAAAAIKVAKGEIGYRESGNNDTKYNRWNGKIPGYPHGGYGYPWCATFQSWCADRAGGRANVNYPRTAGCAVAVSWFKARGRWSSTPHVGDWVFYGPGGGTHVELVEKVSSSSITTIGGNTGGSLSGQYFNGDGVYRKTVSRGSSRIYGYGRPTYSAQEDDMPLSKDDVLAIWNTDGAVPAPRNASTYKENPTWKAASHLVEINERVRDLQKAAAANQAAISELSRAVAQLASDRGQAVDVDALVSRIRQAIESVTIRLDVQE